MLTLERRPGVNSTHNGHCLQGWFSFSRGQPFSFSRRQPGAALVSGMFNFWS